MKTRSLCVSTVSQIANAVQRLTGGSLSGSNLSWHVVSMQHSHADLWPSLCTVSDLMYIMLSSDEEAEAVRGLYLLTAKPVTYAANVAEADLADMGATNSYVKALREKAAEEGREVVIVSAQVLAGCVMLPCTLLPRCPVS